MDFYCPYVQFNETFCLVWPFCTKKSTSYFMFGCSQSNVLNYHIKQINKT